MTPRRSCFNWMLLALVAATWLATLALFVGLALAMEALR